MVVNVAFVACDRRPVPQVPAGAVAGDLALEPGVVESSSVRDPVCRKRTTDLARTMRTVADNMPRRWLLLPIDEGKVRVCAAALLFNR